MTPNLRAIALMVGSMACFAVGDALVKAASARVSVPEVILGMAILGTAIFATLTLRAGDRLFTRDVLAPAVMIRNGVEGVTAICMVSALALAPLSLVASITQAVPLLVTVGAAWVLKEQVGPRRWAAVGIGFCGVLVMLRPDVSGGLAGPLLALGAAVGLAARDLATRLAPDTATTPQMATWGMLSIAPAALILMPFAAPPAAPDPMGYGIVALAALGTAGGYFAITAAMRIGEVAVVAPFRYTRLLFALILAMLFLGERPDGLTLLGAAIVIGSGLYVFWRERLNTAP